MAKARSSARGGGKRALCVGINDYPGTGSDLEGCVNDARDWQRVLAQRGYDVTVLLDGKATRAAMVNALTALIGEARSGDTAVFTYSGHGSWLPDQSGDEADARDEMLCPYDVARGQYLLDDDLAEISGARRPGPASTSSRTPAIRERWRVSCRAPCPAHSSASSRDRASFPPRRF